jgi:hypothetical protein
MSDSITSTASELAKAEGFSPEDINAIAQSEQAASEAGTAVNPSISDDNQGENAPEIGQAFAELAQKKGFKSVDDLVNAYVNMESQGTRTQQELKEIRKEISSLRAPSQPEDPYKDLPPEQKQALGLLEGVVSRIIEQKIRPLQEDVETRNAGKQIDALNTLMLAMLT